MPSSSQEESLIPICLPAGSESVFLLSPRLSSIQEKTKWMLWPAERSAFSEGKSRSSGSWEPQHLGYNYCYLHAAYPDLFAPDYIFNAVQYLLGMHPGRNQAAFVTGVGAETVKAAYGVNRADWSYIPGGVSPGTNLIRPDLPELLHFPFLWQEGEYCLGGHATWFMYMVLASQKILNGNEQ